MAAAHVWIRLRRTGGLAGITTEATVDTADLDPGEARVFLDAVAGADRGGFADAGAPAPPPGPPDTFVYMVEVRRAGTTQRIEVGERAIPGSLQPLVDLLVPRARPVRR